MAINSLTEMHNDFMVYAAEVNNNRAFPDSRDGLKPGMRAALYTMFRKGFNSSKPHVKSAKITGAVIGELWPHGDASVYESIVRMSQPWVNNIPEIEWHGANGSLLGGPEAASSRYTECRLSKASEDGFFANIKKNTVDMIPNFSEDDEWPTVFPAIFPRLFVNGSQGIGYTIAQEWEPGNLTEFVSKVKQYLKKKKITCDDIYPDYPTAGVIINKKDIKSIYETGKGSVILRGKAEIDGNIIKITSLPYQVYVEPFISTIKELVNANKLNGLTGIEDIYNKSDDSGMLIEIECSGDPTQVLNTLYKYTDLQCTFSANQMALVNGKPEMLTLIDYIKYYVEHNVNCIKREYQHDLDEAAAELEILNGLLVAIAHIDDVIKIIKKSKSSPDAKNNLMNTYNLTESQAQAIVDMRLGRLAQLESVKINNNISELDIKVKDLTLKLNSEPLLEKEFVKRLDEFTKNYSWVRKTEVIDVDIKEEKKAAKKVKKATEQYIITLNESPVLTSTSRELKKMALSEYRVPKGNEVAKEVKAIKVGAKDKFILISNKGRMYKLQANKLSLSTMKSSGADISSLLELQADERIINIFSGNEEEQYFFLITTRGNVKKMERDEVFGISKKAGTPIMKLKDEVVVDVYLVNDDAVIEAITSKPKEVNIKVADFKPRGRKASGVRGLKLKTYSILVTNLLN
ncbi:MAG: hypothetical protein IJH65_03880 [Methanobrevibacter sp.]|nr:hypothetical protein [Methanobrevibacter sp.]